MEFSFSGLGHPVLSAALQQLMDLPDELERQLNAPTRAYVRDRRAMANTPMDVKELPSGTLVLAVDMPGPGRGRQRAPHQRRAQAPRHRRPRRRRGRRQQQQHQKQKQQQAANEGASDKPRVKYLRMERRMGKFMRWFPLPEGADLDSIRAEHKDGVLTVTVDKKPPPEPKKPRVVQVTVGEHQGK
ncbi:hypothetical protein PVAP13_1KG194400 [Panicum virgatum]|uniref:SHSP domain-containing protein n=1 Tax=Panicum virgatum TaxID=38727 RepID=A0A8T0X6A8_PANVG|nr:hypothetical protein PVAP13_1KG194400 [Panicum virgatum]